MPCEASPHITGHGLRPPASDFIPSAMDIAGRHSLLLIFCASCDSWYPPFLPSIHVYGGISLLTSLFDKLYKRELYKRESPLLDLGLVITGIRLCFVIVNGKKNSTNSWLPSYLWPIVGSEGRTESGAQTRQPIKQRPPSREAEGTTTGFEKAIHCWTPSKRWLTVGLGL
ncbi:hypothetical protein HYC85_025608 [Camellia sinensis]|uniref:Uncharacterized protein n=1 Tax=Camellia sinensis TaxID=4442 RepID=A0A7J7GBH5_CAMSI|nr:hypothetical protein HYC85_025608 [Camellia sinensis]